MRLPWDNCVDSDGNNQIRKERTATVRDAEEEKNSDLITWIIRA